jgi:hypothetical protein
VYATVTASLVPAGRSYDFPVIIHFLYVNGNQICTVGSNQNGVTLSGAIYTGTGIMTVEYKAYAFTFGEYFAYVTDRTLFVQAAKR